MVLVTVILAHGMCVRAPRSKGEEITAGVYRTLAVFLAMVSALARVEGRAAVLWNLPLTRAERAEQIVQAASERGATWVVGLVAVLVTVLFTALRVKRAPRGASVAAALRSVMAIAVLSVLWLGLDGFDRLRVQSIRSDLWNALAPQFQLFARLDPPAAQRMLPVPHVAPSLRIARDVVAIDSSRVGLTVALSSREGLTALTLDLSHRLAREEEARSGSAQLLLAVDRSVSVQKVARALGVAYGLGISKVEVLFTRGSAPTVAAGAPPEALYAIPRDFGAVEVELSDQRGVEVPGDQSFEQLAREIERQSMESTVVLRVER
jgi:hypothetical protein